MSADSLEDARKGRVVHAVLVAIVPNVGRELPVCSDLLPHHEILTGDFLRTRSLHLEAECSDLLRRGGPEGLDLEGYEFQLSPYLYGARCRLINGVVTAV